MQAILDRMVPSLRDLLDKGVFTESEVTSIVERRRDSEYLLRRRVARAPDYARYIEAEKNLEKLRMLRNKKVVARKIAEERENHEKNGGKENEPIKRGTSSSFGDAHIVQHIHLLYVRAKRKWKHDLKWHIQHAEFAKDAKSHAMLSKIYAEALQLHPRNAALWIESAKHEYFGYVVSETNSGLSGGGAIKNARVLLQRGLRVNPTAKELWLQSFCLELHYIQKLRGRRELLQLRLKLSQKDEEFVDEEEEEFNKEAMESFYEDAKLPRIIYKNAIKSIPSDVNFRLRFKDQCKLFPQTQNVVQEIMVSVENDFGNVEEAWIARASYGVENEGENTGGFLKSSSGSTVGSKRKHEGIDNDKDIMALALLEEATESLQTSKMFIESISFARSYIQKICEDNDTESMDESAMQHVGKIVSFLKKTVKKAEKIDAMSPTLALDCTNVLLELGAPADAVEFITAMTDDNKECNRSAMCWLRRAEVSARLTGNLRSACKILRKAMKIIPLHQVGHREIVSKLFLNLLLLSTTKKSSAIEKEISSLYQKVILLCHQRHSDDFEGTVTVPALSLAYMQVVSSKGNHQGMRKIYDQLLFSSNYTKTSDKTEAEIIDMRTFFEQCISSEQIVKKSGLHDKKSQRRTLIRLHDAAFEFFMNTGYNGIANTFFRKKHEIAM